MTVPANVPHQMTADEAADDHFEALPATVPPVTAVPATALPVTAPPAASDTTLPVAAPAEVPIDSFPESDALPPVPDSVAGLMPGALDDAFDPWSHHEGVDPDPTDIAGFHVEATDGRVGVVDPVSHTLDDGQLIVDIGHLMFGRTVVVPAGSVSVIDRNTRVVYLGQTRDEVRQYPDAGGDAPAADDAGEASRP